MMKKPERLALQKRAEAALAGSATWTRWVRIVNRQDEDGTWRTFVAFAYDGRDGEVWVTPEAITALEDTIALRLFA